MIKFLQNFFCLKTILQKIQVSQAQSNWFIFQEAAAYKDRGAQICTLRIWIGLSKFDNSYAQLWWNLFSETIIAQSIPETKNM